MKSEAFYTGLHIKEQERRRNWTSNFGRNDEEKQVQGTRTVHAPRLDDEKRVKVRKLTSEIVVGQQKKKRRIKLEPGTQTQFVNVAVPVQFFKKSEDISKLTNNRRTCKMPKQRYEK